MHKEFLMGNEALALGALAAGVDVVAGYPGTPSTEVIETIVKRRSDHVYVEWSVNEKAAMEVGAGAAYAGARVLVTMKQVGLNVASDPLMSLVYVGVKGGMVVMVADDPGPISSQTEQDTRTFARFSKLPVFDPTSVPEAYAMMADAFALSERIKSPVFVRATTRIDHGYDVVKVADEEEYQTHEIEGWVRDPKRWVIFPALSVRSHAAIEKRNAELKDELSSYPGNEIVEPKAGPVRLGIASHGINWQYVRENVDESMPVRLLKVATPHPFPEKLALQFLEGLDEVLCVEELDPVIERELLECAGRHHLAVRIRGKLTGDIKLSGENSVAYVGSAIRQFMGAEEPEKEEEAALQLPVRPPVLCAGCPHRASFYDVKRAMKGQKAVFCGDIGCYTLGNAAPLDMCDTCLCMGAGITVAQGLWHVEPDMKAFAFVGDSTFFASGITGVVNAFYNQADLVVCVLDNSTTAMTGHQPHPGTGITAEGTQVTPVSIEKVLRAIGLETVVTINPFDFKHAVETVKEVAACPGVKAIIFKSPCVMIERPKARSHVDAATCIACGRCMHELGCPAIVPDADGKARIDSSQCTGCTLCESICPVHAISGGERL